MLFHDRSEGAQQLILKLNECGFGRGARTPSEKLLVLGIPRGSVPMARLVAQALNADFDVALVHKFTPLWNPELAIGAVTEDGEVRLNDLGRQLELSKAEIEKSAAEQLKKLRTKRDLYTPQRQMMSVKDRVVIIVDDGVATGATMEAAAYLMKQRGAKKVIAAAPVASVDAERLLRAAGIETVFVYVPDVFAAVSLFYEDFPQISDLEVRQAIEFENHREVSIQKAKITLRGILNLPLGAMGIVIFAHGSGSGRLSPRNQMVASSLSAAGMATLLVDLLSPEEARDRSKVFNIDLLADRLLMVSDWVRAQPDTGKLRIGFFGASTGAGAALQAAARVPQMVSAVVSRGGRPDLAGRWLRLVRAPTLLIVGGEDHVVKGLNDEAMGALRCEKKLDVVPGATHLFEEPGALEKVAVLAARWFADHWSAAQEDSVAFRKSPGLAKPEVEG